MAFRNVFFVVLERNKRVMKVGSGLGLWLATSTPKPEARIPFGFGKLKALDSVEDTTTRATCKPCHTITKEVLL